MRDIEAAGQLTDTAGQNCPAGMKADPRGKIRSAAGTANMTAEGHSRGIARGHAEHQIGKDGDPKTGPGLLTKLERSIRTEANPMTKTK